MCFLSAKALPAFCAGLPGALALLLAGPAAAVGPVCETGDFNDFILRYSSEVALQEAATADPVFFDESDGSSGEAPYVTRREIELSRMLWPVMPDLRRVRPEVYSVEILPAADETRLLIRGTETGEHITYFFRDAPCWQLVRVLDQSM